MSRLAVAVTRVGDATDTVLAAVRATPGRVRPALAALRHRRTGILAASVALLLYLVAIGDITSSIAVGAPFVEVAPGWTDRVLQVRAPYLFEPIAAIHPPGPIGILVGPLDLVLGAVLAALVGPNLAVTAHAVARASCRRTGYGRLAAALPALLTGFACCVPAVLIGVGPASLRCWCRCCCRCGPCSTRCRCCCSP
ncbi:MAG: hypothetical protein AB7V42_16910 [Thermoleophilia bacterium]